MYKKIIIIFFTIFVTFLHAKDLNIQDVVDEIIYIKSQLSIVKQNDANNTSNFSETSKKRKDLIAKIPSILTSQSIASPYTQIQYKTQTSKLEQKIAINKNFQNAINRDTLKIDQLDAMMIFYTTLNQIQELIKSPTLGDKFTSTLENSILALKTINIPASFKDSKIKNDYNFEDLMYDLQDTNAIINSYVDILQYLQKNTDLLKPSYILSLFETENIISYINKYIPTQNKYLNMGKILVSIFILFIFFIIRMFLAKRKFLIFVTPFKKNAYDTKTKLSIIKSTNRPLLAILFVFSLKLCAYVIFSPYPKILADSFYIANVVLFAWLFIGISNGYGLALIGTLSSHNDNHFRKEVVNLIFKILYSMVIIVALLLILSRLGVNVSAILASLGIGGLAVAWAAKDILANFFASVLLLIDNSFSQGDWIVCGSVEGIVVEIGLRRTTVRSFDNALLYVPNSTLANAPIRNWTRRKVGRRIKMHVTLTYDSPKDKIALCVEQIRQMLLTHPSIAKPENMNISDSDDSFFYKKHTISMQDLKGYKNTLLVYLDAFSNSSIDILVYCFSKTTIWNEWLETKEDVMFKIMDIVEQNGLSFAFPSQSLYIENLPKEQILQQLCTKNS